MTAATTRRSLGWLNGASVVSVVGLTVACVACGGVRSGGPGGSSTATASAAAPRDPVIPAGAVPWAALPVQPYQAATVPAATVVAAPPCRLQDLAEQPLDSGGAVGNRAVFFEFANHGGTPCLTGGYPHVVVTEPGQPSITARAGGFWDMHAAPAALNPGGTARFSIGYSQSCETGNAPPPYEHVSVTLPGGGTFTETLSGTKPPYSQVPLGIFVQCGVTVSEFAIFPEIPIRYAPDPFDTLTSTLRAPPAVHTGSTLTYLITLTNSSPTPNGLDPCHGYYQTIDSVKSPAFSYELNCKVAHPIAPLGSEDFVMEMPTASVAPGSHSLCWALETASARPATCVAITILG